MAEKVKSVQKIFCSACGKYFVGDTIFDAHHKTYKGDVSRRRCMTAREMREKGFETEKRMVRVILNGQAGEEEHSVWYSVADRERARQAFGRGDAEVEEEQLQDIDVVV